MGNIKDKTYKHLKDQAAASETTTLADIQAQILRKYLSIQGERRAGAPTFTHKRFVNAALSKHVKFQSDDEDGNLPENSEVEEVGDDGEETLREIYATKSKKPPPQSNKSNLVFPYIEKEAFDALSDDVKRKINQQHAYYPELLRQERASKAKGRNNAGRKSSQRSQHITTFIPDSPYDPGPYQQSEDNSPTSDDNPDEDDPIKDTFN